MAHNRKAIRDRMIVILTGLVTTGPRVFASRVYPLQTPDLPGLLVFTELEEVDSGSMRRGLERALTVLIQAVVKSSGGVIDDTLDTIAEEIEAAIEADPNLSGLALYTQLLSTEIEFNAEAEKPVGIMSIRYQVSYRT